MLKQLRIFSIGIFAFLLSCLSCYGSSIIMKRFYSWFWLS